MIAKGARNEDFENDEGKIKQFLRNSMQKYTFITLCLCASVPNPLFDVAGLMAGHFGVPFLEFFTATALGKAVVKVQIQLLFTTLLFTGDHLENFFDSIDNIFPIFNKSFTKLLQTQKEDFFKEKSGQKSVFGMIWQFFIFFMVLFFVISLLNSIVKREHVNFIQKIQKEQEEIPLSLIKFE